MNIEILMAKNKEDCTEVVKYFQDFLVANAKPLKIEKNLFEIIVYTKFFDADKLFDYLTRGYKVEYMRIGKTIVSAIIYHETTGEIPFFAYNLINDSVWVGRSMLDFVAKKCMDTLKTGFFKLKAISCFKNLYLRAGFKVTGSPKTMAELTIIPMEYLIIQNNNEM